MITSYFYKLAKSIAPNWAKGCYHRFIGLKNRNKNPSDVFSSIYASKQWGNSEIFDSGAGSRDENMINAYINAVKNSLESNGLINTRFVDLGCGDFRIGSRVATYSRTYIGCDVVENLIKQLNLLHSSDKIIFKTLDIIKDDLPDGDVCFLRQVLQHLSNEQIQRIIPKLDKYRCVYITEHIPNRSSKFKPNIDKSQGPDIRLYWNSGILLYEKPFSIQKNLFEEILSVPGTPIWEGCDPGLIVTWIYRPNQQLALKS